LLLLLLLLFSHVVRLSLLRTAVTVSPIVSAPGDKLMKIVEQSVERELAGETEVLGESLSQCHFVHLKPQILCPDANPGRRVGNSATNLLSYGTTLSAMAVYRGVTADDSNDFQSTHPVMCLKRTFKWGSQYNTNAQ
jgi:hypothetical protein